MSDEEEYSEEEEVEETTKKSTPTTPKTQEPPKAEACEAEVAMEEKLKKKKVEEEEQWAEYAEQRKKAKQKEEEELRKLKERQALRKQKRAEQEKMLYEFKRKQEEQRIREMEEKKARDAENKRKRLEDAEKKRAAMQAAMNKNAQQAPVERNFVIQKRTDGGPGAALGNTGFDRFSNVLSARSEMGKTKEQLAEDKKIALSFRVKPLNIDGLSVEELKKKAAQLWDTIVQLESDKYDLEERQKRQDYDLKELAERQRQINRNKALKKGLDPDALSDKFPPKILTASKYERRLDRRNFVDKKKLFEGELDAQVEAMTEKQWEEKMKQFKERERNLPKWDPAAPKNKETFEPGVRTYDADDDDLDILDAFIKPPGFEEVLGSTTTTSTPASKPAPAPAKQEEESEEEEEEEEEEEDE